MHNYFIRSPVPTSKKVLDSRISRLFWLRQLNIDNLRMERHGIIARIARSGRLRIFVPQTTLPILPHSAMSAWSSRNTESTNHGQHPQTMDLSKLKQHRGETIRTAHP